MSGMRTTDDFVTGLKEFLRLHHLIESAKADARLPRRIQRVHLMLHGFLGFEEPHAYYVGVKHEDERIIAMLLLQEGSMLVLVDSPAVVDASDFEASPHVPELGSLHLDFHTPHEKHVVMPLLAALDQTMAAEQLLHIRFSIVAELAPMLLLVSPEPLDYQAAPCFSLYSPCR